MEIKSVVNDFVKYNLTESDKELISMEVLNEMSEGIGGWVDSERVEVDTDSKEYKIKYQRALNKYGMRKSREMLTPMYFDVKSYNRWISSIYNYDLDYEYPPSSCFVNMRLSYGNLNEARLQSIQNILDHSRIFEDSIVAKALDSKELQHRKKWNDTRKIWNPINDSIPPCIIAADYAVTRFTSQKIALNPIDFDYGLKLESLQRDSVGSIQLYLSEVFSNFNLWSRKDMAKNYIMDPQRFNPIIDDSSSNKQTKISKTLLNAFGVLGAYGDEYFRQLLDKASMVHYDSYNGNKPFIIIQFRTVYVAPKGVENYCYIIDLQINEFDLLPNHAPLSMDQDTTLDPKFLRYDEKIKPP